MPAQNPRVFYRHQLQKRRAPRKRRVAPRPELSIRQILRWADEFHEATGRWPTGSKATRIPGSLGEHWSGVDDALRSGYRGLPGGSSLAKLLAAKRGVRNRKDLPKFTIPNILRWADAHHRRTGKWPHYRAGPIADAPGETWGAVDAALVQGSRGLPGGSSIARVLDRRRGVRNPRRPPKLTVKQILAWADAWHERTGAWPKTTSGPVPDAPGETWAALGAALQRGNRGLRGGSSLAKLLAAKRGVRNRTNLPNFTIPNILRWADAHHRRTGKWPHHHAGPIADAPGETWGAVEAALVQGSRGFPGGSSIARVLDEHRGVRNRGRLPKLTVKQILAWADAWHERTGAWPKTTSGPIPEATGETWASVGTALQRGSRGLRGGSSIAKLLARRRGVRNRGELPKFTIAKILRWADAHFRRTGAWPRHKSGRVVGAPGETWQAVEKALAAGQRGLPGGSSIAKLLADRRGLRRPGVGQPRLSRKQILAWADAHHRRTGRWPTASSGAIRGAEGEKWSRIDAYLRLGLRGLPAGCSLAQLLARHRGARNKANLPKLTLTQILAWADAHHRRTSAWPTQRSGPIPNAAGETWSAIDAALQRGGRGLRGGSSLARLLARRRGVRNGKALPKLTIARILRWADAHHRRAGAWPKRHDGPVVDSPGETWAGINAALVRGRRGLPPGLSLPRVLSQHRGARNHNARPKLTLSKILAWADAHHRRTGAWPTQRSGPIQEAPGETWSAVCNALQRGARGLRRGSSLAQLLERRRGARNRKAIPKRGRNAKTGSG